MLRFSIFVSVIASVLAGNVWGFRSAVMQQFARQANGPVIGPDWMKSVEMYFTVLPETWQVELPFLLAGLIGAWAGLRFLKTNETIDVQ